MISCLYANGWGLHKINIAIRQMLIKLYDATLRLSPEGWGMKISFMTNCINHILCVSTILFVPLCWYVYLFHAQCWLTSDLLITVKHVFDVDVISVRYKEKGTSFVTSQWRSRGDHGRRPLPLPLRCDRATLSLCDDLGKINGISGVINPRKRFMMWQTSFERGMNSLPFVCFRRYGNLSTLNIAFPCKAFSHAWYCDAKCE